MKDIPIFAGQFGTATLIFREIPYKACAYVILRSVLEGRLAAFLDECRQFCALAGAEWALVSADEPLAGLLPHVHDMLELACPKKNLPPPAEPVELEPLGGANGETFRRLYNQLLRAIPNAATCTQADVRRILEGEHGYLALVDGQYAGFGQWSGAVLRAIGVLPEYRGLGHRLALTLLAEMRCETVTLQVSSSNGPALRLYQRLGFDRSRVLSRWYALLGPEGGATPTAE